MPSSKVIFEHLIKVFISRRVLSSVRFSCHNLDRSDAISIFTPARVLLRPLYKAINVKCLNLYVILYKAGALDTGPEVGTTAYRQEIFF
jgi:hypothetical protein